MDEKGIESKGRDERRCPYCCEPIHADAVKCRHCKSTLDPMRRERQWHREYPGRMLLGVCSSIAVNYAIPVTLVRLAFVLLTFFHCFGILLYVILWAVIPAQDKGNANVRRMARAVRRSYAAARDSFRDEFSGEDEDQGRVSPG